MNRYNRSNVIQGGKGLSTNRSLQTIRRMRDRGQIKFRKYVIKEGERLDHIAAKTFGSSQMWWVIAIMSDIGWSLQVPPGTVLKIPVDLGQIGGVTL